MNSTLHPMTQGVHKECNNMFNKEIIVRCESGLHNRQATYFVQKANEFNSSIWIESDNRKMNAKSLLGIMSLGIVTGATVTLSAMGPDAEAAVTALEALLQRDVY
jgi:phosphocarrier protein